MQGFSMPSADGTILISNEVPGLFLAGVYLATGSTSGVTSFPNYGGSLTGNRTYKFSLPVEAGHPPPALFLYPGSGNNLGYGLLQTDKVGANWSISIIQAGTALKAPRLYAYASLEEVKQGGSMLPVGTVGLQVMGADGRVHVDSRYQHLAVIASPTLTHDPMPCDGGKPGADTYTNKHDYTYVCPSLQKDMQCTNSTVSATTAVPSTGITEYMFMLTVGAQASYVRKQTATFTSKGNWFNPNQKHERLDVWGCRYQAVISVGGGTSAVTVTAAWAHYQSSYLIVRKEDNSDTWDGIRKSVLDDTIGIDSVGRAIDRRGASSSGSVPYTNETINTRACVVPVVAMSRVLLETPVTAYTAL